MRKFAAVHASVYDLFRQENHLCSRHRFKLDRAAVLAERRQLCAA